MTEDTFIAEVRELFPDVKMNPKLAALFEFDGHTAWSGGVCIIHGAQGWSVGLHDVDPPGTKAVFSDSLGKAAAAALVRTLKHYNPIRVTVSAPAKEAA